MKKIMLALFAVALVAGVSAFTIKKAHKFATVTYSYNRTADVITTDQTVSNHIISTQLNSSSSWTSTSLGTTGTTNKLYAIQFNDAEITNPVDAFQAVKNQFDATGTLPVNTTFAENVTGHNYLITVYRKP